MTPTTSLSSQHYRSQNMTTDNVNQLLQTANFFRQYQQQMQDHGDVNQEQFLDNLVSQLLEESQSQGKGPPPASHRFMISLPTIAKKSLSSEETCIICKEILQSSQDKVTKMPCGHYFDEGCLLPWLQLHHTCPMCRFKVETEEQAKQEEEEEARDFMYG
ncbi:uncharacterized protein BX664DRAFT_341045 [Halteromyces radiatus]|uniref:uncharacterized protein n=1 Tax=Halteromyces radiatus TaxID=101107 RepID=UPI00221EBE46|nr:uncharacterized protein BX664DRAFT_341045 [Halteromyces radiatus]KAI8081693.1 hypothetical protein BX664DRAFT_341045 [Halteromyces radiatus]